MKLTLALDMIAPPGKAATGKTPEKAQNSAIPAEFASLLDGEGEAANVAQGEIVASIAELPGKALPPETGKTLPPAAQGVAAVVPDAMPQVAQLALVQAPVTETQPVEPAMKEMRVDRQAMQPQLPLSAAEVAPPRHTAPVQTTSGEASPADGKPQVQQQTQPLRIEVKAESAPQPLAIRTMPATAPEGAQQPRAPRQAAAPQVEADVEAISSTRADIVQMVRRQRAQPVVPASAAENTPREGQQATSRAPAPAPAQAPAALQPLAPNTPLVAEAPQQQAVTSTGERMVTPPQQAERHDFSAVVERLAQAREMAQPGRADLQMMHREFGNISVQFEMAGQSLRVALSSGDAGFAPAVQAALAERPIMPVGESQRADAQMARSDSQTGPGGSSQHGQPATQNQSDSNSRGAPQRQQSGQAQPHQQANGEGASARSNRNAGERGLFA